MDLRAVPRLKRDRPARLRQWRFWRLLGHVRPLRACDVGGNRLGTVRTNATGAGRVTARTRSAARGRAAAAGRAGARRRAPTDCAGDARRARAPSLAPESPRGRARVQT